MFPIATVRSPGVHEARRQTGSSGARARAPRYLGARRNVRAAPRAKPRRAALVVRRRPRDGEQDRARRPHGVGADAQGRLPALQGAARLRPALPERLRLPGALDRGRRRARARAQLEAARSRTTASRRSPRSCRDVVVRSSSALTRGSKRLGQWMDWGNDYFTFSDTNIEYIWKFLKLVHARGWLVKGHRSTEWCPRCGTSLSQHELTQAGVYQDRADPSLFVRFPLLDRPGESLVIWTTTPWTLPANVAAAVHPDEEYGRRESGEWVAVKLFPDDVFVERLPGRELVGWRYRGPFDDLPPGSQVEHRVIPWEDVTMDQGTGIVHIATGLRRRGLRARPAARPAGPHTGRRVGTLLRRLRLVARAVDDRGRRPDHRPARRRGPARRSRAVHARLPALLALRHAADLPDRRRLVHRGRRDPAEAARGEREGHVGAGVHGEADGRLAAEHGRLEHLAPALLRPAAAALPLRVRPSERDRLEGRARGARGRGDRAARGAAPAVDRPGPDPLRAVRRDGHADPRGRRRLARRGDRPVRDARLGERGVDHRGLRDRRGEGSDDRRPARPRVLGAVVPGRLGLGDARADPALVLLAVLHVGRADRALAVQARAGLREDARREGS